MVGVQAISPREWRRPIYCPGRPSWPQGAMRAPVNRTSRDAGGLGAGLDKWNSTRSRANTPNLALRLCCFFLTYSLGWYARKKNQYLDVPPESTRQHFQATGAIWSGSRCITGSASRNRNYRSYSFLIRRGELRRHIAAARRAQARQPASVSERNIQSMNPALSPKRWRASRSSPHKRDHGSI